MEKTEKGQLESRSTRDATAGCSCAAWATNIPKIDAPFLYLNARNPETYGGYEGVVFSYCPWCGEKL